MTTLRDAIATVSNNFSDKQYDVQDEVRAELQKLMPDYQVCVIYESDLLFDFVQWFKDNNLIGKRILEIDTDTISLWNDFGHVVAIKFED